MAEEEMMMVVATTEEEKPEPTQRRKNLVSDLQSRVQNAKGFHEKAFECMKEDMEAVYNGFVSKDYSNEFYVANILQRHVQQRTAALYAKNPKAVPTRRDRMEYTSWNEDPNMLKMAYAALQMEQKTGVPAAERMQRIVNDYESVQARRRELDNIAKTLERLFDYYMNEQQPSFKAQMKALVRRVITTGVGFVKVTFQRDVDRQPEVAARIADVQAQLDHMRRIATEASKGKIKEDDPEVEELMLSLRSLEQEPMVTIREGLVFDFPEPDSIIVDPFCQQLRGFVGARWIAHQMYMSKDEVYEIYNVDLENNFTSYDMKGMRTDLSDPFKRGYPNFGYQSGSTQEIKDGLVLVWEYYDKAAGLQYCIADGYPDFLMEPQAPQVSVESFWPIYALVFNELEHSDKLYPPSDVRLLMPMQQEYNRARQGLREHRRANRPKYAAPSGMLEDEDKMKLQTHPANALIELQALASGQKVNDVIQPVAQIGIDPNLYEVKTIFDDVQLVVGSQEATYGGVSKATATETSIAEQSRMSSLGAQVDELDSFMSEIARAAGQVMLAELSVDEVKRVVGPGAAWPNMSRDEIMEEIYLEIEAGSTGKPNRAAELRNIERIIPFLIQIPGIDPGFLAKELLKRLDDKLDFNQAIVEQIPSIVAMNQAQNLMGAGNADAPQLQGQQGQNNAPRPRQVPGAGQAPMGAEAG